VVSGLVLLQDHFLIECGHRHLADDVIRLRLIATVDNVSLLLVGEHRSSCCGAITPIGIERCTIQLDQRHLDLADVLTARTLMDACGVRHGGGFEFRVASEQLRLESHASALCNGGRTTQLFRTIWSTDPAHICAICRSSASGPRRFLPLYEKTV